MTPTSTIPDTKPSRRNWLPFAVLLASVLGGSPGMVATAADDEVKLPPFTAVQRTVDRHFATLRGRQPGDLISRSEVAQALSLVEKLGWRIDDRQAILEQTLPDQHVLITTFRSPAGQKLMRQISSRPLMYDRLDRIAAESGGPQLIKDLVKLPDGERYAKPRSGEGVPDLLDLLPKTGSGRTRQIAGYHEPTGNLYTVSDLVARLEASYRAALESLQP